MNNDHDNAQDDKIMLHRIETDMAIQQFKRLMNTELSQEVAEFNLTKKMRGHIDMDRYFEETEKIRAQFEQKRQEYVRSGLLPKESE